MAQESNTQRKITNKETGASYIYDTVILLGQATATVYGGIIEATSELVAVKVISLRNNPENHKSLSNEINLHKKLCNEHNSNSEYNIVKFIDAFQTQNNLYIILEYCDGKTLKDLLLATKGAGLGNQRALQCWIPIMQSVSLLHSKGLMHRDLKPENVVFKGNKCMLIDFGLLTDEEKSDMYCGTVPYMAPEVLRLQKGDLYGREADMWSLGVILYELVYGCRPYKGRACKIAEQMEKSLKLPQSSAVWKEIQDLTRELLRVDPSERMTADKINAHSVMVKLKESYKEEEVIVRAFKYLMENELTGPYLKSLMEEGQIEVTLEDEGEDEKVIVVKQVKSEESIKLMVPKDI